MNNTVTISRYALEDLLMYARLIATCEKTAGIPESSNAYAHALGRCHGAAKLMLIHLELLEGVAKLKDTEAAA